MGMPAILQLLITLQAVALLLDVCGLADPSKPAEFFSLATITRGCALLFTFNVVFEVYNSVCSVRLSRHSGQEGVGFKGLGRNWPVRLNWVWDCFRPGLLLAHFISGAVYGYWALYTWYTVCSVDSTAALPIAVLAAEYGAVAGISYTVYFIRENKFHIRYGAVQSRRFYRTMWSIKVAGKTALSVTVRYHLGGVVLYKAFHWITGLSAWSPLAMVSLLYSDRQWEFESLMNAQEGVLPSTIVAVSTAWIATVLWTLNRDFVEILWTQLPARDPTIADIKFCMEKSDLPLVQHMAYALLHRILQRNDNFSLQLFEDSMSHPPKPHWQELCKNLIKTTKDIWNKADALAAAKPAALWTTTHFAERPLEDPRLYQQYLMIGSKGGTTQMARFELEKRHGEGFAAAGWDGAKQSAPKVPKQYLRSAKLPGLAYHAALFAGYGALWGGIFGPVVGSWMLYIYGIQEGSTQRGTFVGQAVRVIDPNDDHPALIGALVGMSTGAVLGAVTGINVYVARRLWQLWRWHIDWWLLAVHWPDWWNQPDMPKPEVIKRLQGQANGTFIVHRDDSEKNQGQKLFALTVVQTEPRQPDKAPTFWSGIIESNAVTGYVLRNAPLQLPNRPDERFPEPAKFSSLRSLVAYYAVEPYLVGLNGNKRHRLANMDKRAHILDWPRECYDRLRKSPTLTAFENRLQNPNAQNENPKGVLGGKSRKLAVLLSPLYLRLWKPAYRWIYNETVDDKRRKVFSDFAVAVLACRCLAEGLTVANAAAENSVRAVVIRTVMQEELEYNPDDRGKRDVRQLPLIVKTLLRVREGMLVHRDAGGYPEDVPVELNRRGEHDGVLLDIKLSAAPQELYGMLFELELALSRILWAYHDQVGVMLNEFHRVDPKAAKRLESFITHGCM